MLAEYHPHIPSQWLLQIKTPRLVFPFAGIVHAYPLAFFDLRFFNANVQTGKKATEEEISSGVATEKKAILNLVLDDGTENIRAVFFNEMVQKMGLSEYSDEELMKQQKENLLGKEFVFGGNVRMNSYFNTPELIVDSIDEINVERLIDELDI